MNDPQRESKPEKKPSPSPTPPSPTPSAEPAPSAEPPPSAESTQSAEPRPARGATAAAAGTRRPQAPFEEAYSNYVQRRLRLWSELQEGIGDAYRTYTGSLSDVALDAQRHGEEAYRAYADAAREASESEEIQQRSDEAYRSYMKSLQEAWGAEEAQQRSQEAHDTYLGALEEISHSSEPARRLEEAQRNYEQALQRAWSPEVALKYFDAYRDYTQALKQAREEYQKGCARAYDRYVRELQGAWGSVGDEGIDMALLSAIGQSIVAVAFYASEGSAPYS